MSDIAYADMPEIAEDEAMLDDVQSGADRLMQFAEADGDISDLLTETELAALGMRVATDWERDKASNQTWRDAAEKALKQAAQEDGDVKTFPWANAANVQYPILTVAAQQFAGRAYPAIVKGDEAVGVKVLGDVPQKPELPSNLPPPDQMPPEMQQQLQAVMQGYEQQQAAWKAKGARARRVKTWMNYHLFYGMDDWEGSVDALLNQLPITGMAFKKVYFDPHRGVVSDYVNPLHLTVPPETQSLDRCPRITQDFELYPYEIRARQASGVYRETDTLVSDGDDDQASRCILEQHRLEDLDDDGIEEPYIITVDERSNQVLRIEAAYSADDIARSKTDDSIVHIKRWVPFIPFPFMPDPEGKFYGLGFGQLLAPLSAVINSTINQLMDAGTAAAAGGGFIGSGLRLQGAGQTTTLRFQPGEYKFVTANGQDMRSAIWERTIPQPSPVLYQLLDLVLGAAKEVASIKDVLSGESPATAPVGTTLALIEQGLQSFTAIYKRVYRSMKREFRAIYECQAKWGSDEEYREVLDDPAADLKVDFGKRGEDIVPVSDPTVVTRAQALAKAQVIQQTAAAFPQAVNPVAAVKRIFEAAQIDEADELIVQPSKEPPPNVVAEIKETESKAAMNTAHAKLYEADAAVKAGEAQQEGAERAAFELGATDLGRVPGLAGQPSGDAMGAQGAPQRGGPPAPGLGQPDMGGGPPVGGQGGFAGGPAGA